MANAAGSATISILISFTKIWSFFDITQSMAWVLIGLAGVILVAKKSIDPPQLDTKQGSLLFAYQLNFKLMRNALVLPAICSQALPEVFNYVVLPLWSIGMLSNFMSADATHLVATACLLFYGLAGLLSSGLYYWALSPMKWMMLQYLGSGLVLGVLLLTPVGQVGAWGLIFVFVLISGLLGASNVYISTYLASLFDSKVAGTVIGVYVYMSQCLVGGATFVFSESLSRSGGVVALDDYLASLWGLFWILIISSVICWILSVIRPYYPKLLPVK